MIADTNTQWIKCIKSQQKIIHCTKDVTWTFKRRSSDMQNVFLKSYVRSSYFLYQGSKTLKQREIVLVYWLSS